MYPALYWRDIVCTIVRKVRVFKPLLCKTQRFIVCMTSAGEASPNHRCKALSKACYGLWLRRKRPSETQHDGMIVKVVRNS